MVAWAPGQSASASFSPIFFLLCFTRARSRLGLSAFAKSYCKALSGVFHLSKQKILGKVWG